MLKKIEEIIKKQDSFGYQFNLKFNKKEDTYNTLIGGLGSVSMNILILYMFCQQMNIMLSKTQFQYYPIDSMVDFNQMEQVNVSKLNLLLYFQIQQSNSSHDFDPNFFLNNVIQFNESNNGNSYNQPRICTQEDFSKVESEQIFQSYNQSSTLLLCLNLNDTLQGPLSHNIVEPFSQQQAIQWTFQTCSQTNPLCLDQPSFQRYVQGLKIVVHIIRPEINLNIKNGSPTMFKDIVHDIAEFNDFFQRYILIRFRKNVIEISGLLNFLSSPVFYEFYDMDKNSLFVNLPIKKTESPFDLYKMDCGFSQNKITHQIIYYGIFDVLGWVGGNQIYVVILFNIFFGAFAAHIFQIKIIESSFLITKKKFQKEIKILEKNDAIQQIDNQEEKIEFSYFQIFYLHLVEYFNEILETYNLSFEPTDNIFKIFKKGQSILRKQTDVIEFIRKSRYLQIYFDNKDQQENFKNLKKSKIKILDMEAESSQEEENDQNYHNLNLQDFIDLKESSQNDVEQNVKQFPDQSLNDETLKAENYLNDQFENSRNQEILRERNQHSFSIELSEDEIMQYNQNSRNASDHQNYLNQFKEQRNMKAFEIHKNDIKL